MNKLLITDTYIARLLMLSFFLPMSLQAVAVMVVSVYFVCRSFQIKQAVPRSNFVWALVLGSGYLLYLFAIPMTPAEDKMELLQICGNRVSLLLMPFLFAVISPAFGGLLRRELLWFVYGCIVSCIIANLGFAYEYFFVADKHVLSHMAYRTTLEAVSGIHPTYMSMYLCFSICILLLSNEFGSRNGKIIKYSLLYLLLVFLLSLFAKSPLIALGVILIHYAYLNRQSLFKHKALVAGMLAAIAAACIFIPFIGQRAQEIFSYFGFGKQESFADNSVNIRKLIWDVDTGLIKENWLAGVGPGGLLRLLHERYFFYSLAHQFNIGYYDPHNEYFYAWLCFGIAGIVLFLTILVVHIAKAMRSKDLLYTYLLIILCITFCTETVLSRQMGVLFYTVFTSLFFFLNSYHKPDNSKQG